MKLAAFAGTVLLALVVVAGASAHARVSPAVSISGELQLYSLAVPTEKENVTTKSIELTLPKGFSIDSFVPAPGWTRSSTATTVTWTGGSTPTEEDSLFQFLAQPATSGTYTFEVKQTYSDGSVVQWSDPESGEDPAPTISVKSSLGGGGTSTLTIVALVVGAAGVLIGGLALVARGDRALT